MRGSRSRPDSLRWLPVIAAACFLSSTLAIAWRTLAFYQGRGPDLPLLARLERLMFLSFNWLWFALAIACFMTAILLLLEKNASILPSHIPGRRTTMAVGSIVIAALILSKVGQYFNFQLTADSGPSIHGAWMFLHGFGFENNTVGGSIFLDHFRLFTPFLSVAMLLSESGVVIAAVHGLALGLTIVGVFLLAKRHSGDEVCALLIALLALGHPLFLNLILTPLDDCVLAPCFFVWAAYFWETERWPAAAILLALILTLKEEAPFLLFGVGLYLIATLRDRHRYWGAALCATAVVLWRGEMSLIESTRGAFMSADCQDFSGWSLFGRIGGSREAVLSTALHQPWRIVIGMFYPFKALFTPIMAIACVAFLPVAAGWTILPAFIAWLPHQLADYNNSFHIMDGWYSGFVVGPLFWAAASGSRLWRDLSPRLRSLAAAYLLATAAAGLSTMPGRYLLDWRPPYWLASVPKALEQVPTNAKVWCDAALIPQLATRRYVRQLPNHLPACYFDTRLFVPDRVVVSSFWATSAEPRTVDRIFGLLKSHGFHPLFQNRDLVVLGNPEKEELGAPVNLVDLRLK